MSSFKYPRTRYTSKVQCRYSIHKCQRDNRAYLFFQFFSKKNIKCLYIINTVDYCFHIQVYNIFIITYNKHIEYIIDFFN